VARRKSIFICRAAPVLEYGWRKIDQNGEMRLQDKLILAASGELRPKLADTASEFGRVGEHLQIVDQQTG
jgi:hypothetical protein